MSQRRVQRLINLGTMSREIHELVDESRLSMTAALRLKDFDIEVQLLFAKFFKAMKLNLTDLKFKVSFFIELKLMAIKFFYAIRADSVGKNCLCACLNIAFQMFPISLIASDFFATCTDGQKSA